MGAPAFHAFCEGAYDHKPIPNAGIFERFDKAVSRSRSPEQRSTVITTEGYEM